MPTLHTQSSFYVHEGIDTFHLVQFTQWIDEDLFVIGQVQHFPTILLYSDVKLFCLVTLSSLWRYNLAFLAGCWKPSSKGIQRSHGKIAHSFKALINTCSFMKQCFKILYLLILEMKTEPFAFGNILLLTWIWVRTFLDWPI